MWPIWLIITTILIAGGLGSLYMLGIYRVKEEAEIKGYSKLGFVLFAIFFLIPALITVLIINPNRQNKEVREYNVIEKLEFLESLYKDKKISKKEYDEARMKTLVSQ